MRTYRVMFYRFGMRHTSFYSAVNIHNAKKQWRAENNYADLILIAPI